MMEWKDIIAKAPTGTGKTFAFGIPLIEHIERAGATLAYLTAYSPDLNPIEPRGDRAFTLTESNGARTELISGLELGDRVVLQ